MSSDEHGSSPRITATFPSQPVDMPFNNASTHTSPIPLENARSSKPSSPEEVTTPDSTTSDVPLGEGDTAEEVSELRWTPKNQSRKSSGTSETDMMGPLRGLGRGKNCKDKVGWGNLPTNIMNTILSYVMDDVNPELRLIRTWSDHPSYEIVLAVKQRLRLCELRHICIGWKDAVDSHSFWAAYAALLDRTGQYAAIMYPLYSYRNTSSSPVSGFHHARAATVLVCLACRLNHPQLPTSFPAVRKRLTLTSYLGRAPTCEHHNKRYCLGCMRDNIGGLSADDLYVDDNMRNIYPAKPHDIDADGNERPYGSMSCRDCREIALISEIRRLLKECARGGYQLRGNLAPWRAKPLVLDYLDYNVGTVPWVAYQAVEEQWLMDHTRWSELLPTAIRLQRHEKTLKARFLLDQTQEKSREKIMRLAMLAELKGEELDESELDNDAMEMERMYIGWWKDLTRTEEGHDTEEDDEDLDEDDGDETFLGNKYRNKLRWGCINDFLVERIRAAFWVLPSDEVHKLAVEEQAGGRVLPSAIHTNFEHLAEHCIHPFGKRIDIEYIWYPEDDEVSGLINIPPWHSRRRSSKDTFLPPSKLLRELDDKFSQKLMSLTSGPMKEIVGMLKERFGDDDQAESFCAEVRMEGLLGMLAHERNWLPIEMKGRDVGKLEEERQAWEERLKNRTTQLIVEADRSPRVEMVYEDIGEIDYGIKEEALTPSEPGDEIPHREFPVLGKRKSPPPDETEEHDERTSGKRSKSSSDAEDEPEVPVTLLRNTSTHTPSRIAQDDDPDSAGLGKRKLPPSPESHHIDRSKRQITPPPPPQFDADPKSKVRERLMLDKHTAESGPPSSAPASPSPILLKIPTVNIQLGTQQSTQDREGVRVHGAAEGRNDIDGHSPTATIDGSHRSSTSAGTCEVMPITPEMEEWVESGGIVRLGGEEQSHLVMTPKLNCHDELVLIDDGVRGHTPGFAPAAERDHQGEHTSSAVFSTSVEADADEASEQSSPRSSISSPPHHPDLVDLDEGRISGEEESGSEFDDDDDDDEIRNEMIGRIRAEYDKMIEAQKKKLELLETKVPWIPQPFVHHSTSSRMTMARNDPSINLGPGANGILMSGWYEARAELRECRCKICERARRRAWDSMMAIRRAVGEGWMGLMG
ncbi:hypothetical protein CI109_103287 [Kwoniella shandongensis]|uniref:Uncharacterized protein n=1 Tax=Kwoniella shandongensis TaxID=1734106 RepID=A0A5M6BU41_9TREE|nr:uncharacterized protein CI109_006041 [Kwoniella shandongensis]KAA5525590.1 hypothetical protein CI109_006041 [Kwoniella shandongensis]